MRTIELHDKKVEKALAEKGRLIDAGREISQQIEDLQTEQRKLGLKIQKIKDDVVLPFAEELKKTLGKYEDLETLKLVHGKIVVEVFDYLERYKEQLDEELDKKAKEELGEIKKDDAIQQPQ